MSMEARRARHRMDQRPAASPPKGVLPLDELCVWPVPPNDFSSHQTRRVYSSMISNFGFEYVI